MSKDILCAVYFSSKPHEPYNSLFAFTLTRKASAEYKYFEGDK